MKKLFYTACLMLLSLMISVNAVAGEKSPVKMTWELNGNNAAKNQYYCTFTLTNTSGENLGSDWAIYFNHFPRAISFGENSPVTFSEVEVGYYKLTPKPGFKLGKGKTIKLKYEVKGSMKAISYSPDGGHFAFNSDKVARELKIEKKPIVTGTFSPIAGYPTAARMYALNETVNPAGVTEEFDAFSIIPAMKQVNVKEGTSSVAQPVKVVADGRLSREKAYADEMLQHRNLSGEGGTTLELSLMSRADAQNSAARDNAEYYELTINGNKVTVKGVTDDAVMNGVKAYIKILDRNFGKESVPNVAVCDWPDLHYRGMMLDIARNFSKADDLKRLINQLAFFNMNVFHFHFCDDEGWRLEIPGLPELTEVGARRGMTSTEDEYMCQFYAGNGNPDDFTTTSNGYVSREEFIDLLRYADARGIKVIPEIETPGHARAAIVSMKARYNRLKDTDPEEANRYRLWDPADESYYSSAQGYHDNTLNVAEEGVYRFVEKVVDELILMYEEAGVELPFIHVGGDEVAKDPWVKSPSMQKFMKEHGLKTTHDAEEYFITRIADMIASKGYQIGGWQEAAMKHSEATDQQLRPKFAGVYCWNTVPEWKGDTIPYANANNGYNVILCNVSNFYLDMCYNAHPMEPGLTWGGYVDEYRSWDARPFDIYKSSFETITGKPLDLEHIADGKAQLNEESRKRIKGVQGQLFSETIRNFDMVEYYVFPKIFGLMERGWNTDLLPEQSKAKYNRTLGTTCLPYLQREGFNFRIGMPGIKEENGKLLMNCAYPEAEIRYTTDGSEPTEKSALWTAPVKAKGKVVKAKMFYLGKQSQTTELHR